MIMKYKAVVCTLTASADVTVSGNAWGGLCDEAVVYAVCRFFSKCEALCRWCAYESYSKRLAKGKSKKPRRCCQLIRASLLELPGRWVQVGFTVDSTGVTVTSIRFVSEKPDVS